MRRSPPRWGLRRGRSVPRWRGRAGGWSKPIGRRSASDRRSEGSMSHLDEGTLHAMLDGELEPSDVAEIQAHLASCSSCGLRLREVREFLDEADRLIASVDMDGVTAAPMRRLAPEIG